MPTRKRKVDNRNCLNLLREYYWLLLDLRDAKKRLNRLKNEKSLQKQQTLISELIQARAKLDIELAPLFPDVKYGSPVFILDSDTPPYGYFVSRNLYDFLIITPAEMWTW